MGEMRGSVQNAISVASLGSATDVSMMTSYRASTVTMATGSTNSSAISIDSSGSPNDPENDPAFEGLNMDGPRVDEQDDIVLEEMVDRGAQNGDRVLNDQIEFVQNLERERIYAAPNVTRDRWNNPNHNYVLDREDDIDYLWRGEQLPMFTEDPIMDLDPPLPGYQRRRQRPSFLESTNTNTRPRQRPRQQRMDLEPTLPRYQQSRRQRGLTNNPRPRRMDLD